VVHFFGRFAVVFWGVDGFFLAHFLEVGDGGFGFDGHFSDWGFFELFVESVSFGPKPCKFDLRL